MQQKLQRLKFHDFNICPNILQVDADADAEGIAIALLHLSAGVLKIGNFSHIFFLSHILCLSHIFCHGHIFFSKFTVYNLLNVLWTPSDSSLLFSSNLSRF